MPLILGDQNRRQLLEGNSRASERLLVESNVAAWLEESTDNVLSNTVAVRTTRRVDPVKR